MYGTGRAVETLETCLRCVLQFEAARVAFTDFDAPRDDATDRSAALKYRLAGLVKTVESAVLLLDFAEFHNPSYQVRPTSYQKPRSMRVSLSRLFLSLALALVIILPAAAQVEEEEAAPPEILHGYIYQNAITPESYLITSPEELKAFTQYLSPVKPYKILPAPPSNDPFLKGLTVDFEQNVVVVAVGRDRIEGFPEYLGTYDTAEGEREVRFVIPAPASNAFPYGWAIYSGLILPRTEAQTRIQVEHLKKAPTW